MTEMFEALAGEGGKVWPKPIGRDADDAVWQFESIRRLANALDQWTLEELSANNFESKIEQGLTSAGVPLAEALETTRDLVRLMRVISEDSRSLAATAKIAGERINTRYIERIKAERAKGRRRPDGGLKVN